VTPRAPVRSALISKAPLRSASVLMADTQLGRLQACLTGVIQAGALGRQRQGLLSGEDVHLDGGVPWPGGRRSGLDGWCRMSTSRALPIWTEFPPIRLPAMTWLAGPATTGAAACDGVKPRGGRMEHIVSGVVESPEATALLDELATTSGREDPYPRYDRLRRIAAIVRAGDGTLVVARHADCTAVIRDWRMQHQPAD
jgi:hypothetical protein